MTITPEIAAEWRKAARPTRADVVSAACYNAVASAPAGIFVTVRYVYDQIVLNEPAKARRDIATVANRLSELVKIGKLTWKPAGRTKVFSVKEPNEL
jgi:hypothetical protein